MLWSMHGGWWRVVVAGGIAAGLACQPVAEAPPPAETPAPVVAPRQEAPSAPEAPPVLAPALPPRVGVVARWAEIRAEPRSTSAPIGRMRGGQTVALRSTGEGDPTRPVGADDGCRSGFVAVVPRGFLCRDGGTTLDLESPALLALAALLPRTDGPLPYTYAHTRGVHHYHYLPTEAQLRSEEGRHLATSDAVDSDDALARYMRRPREGVPVRADVYEGRSVAWARTITLGGRRWHVTPWPSLVPAARVEAAEPAPSAGRALPEASGLPFVFANGRPFGPVWRYRAATFGFTRVGPLPPWSFLDVSGPVQRGMVPLTDGHFVRADAVNLFRPEPPPSHLAEDEKWVSVHLASETLIAYEGSRPVYAAAVSTGAHGASGPLRTALGTFRVATKWRTHTMGGLNVDGSSYRAPEVPFAAYYDRGRALHGAWWHDWFGHPRSHGCINLAPADARWLFAWLEPRIPEGWYVVKAAAGEGTTVVVRL